jgi:adenosylcobinamide kinase/adenosylcobinamide-phosphate guanylyltransferase
MVADPGPPRLTLLLGGVRSGKSDRAVALAAEAARDGRVLFVATAQAFDDEMRRRIDAHRRERPSGWDTLESPLDLAADLARALEVAEAHGEPYAAVVIDCLTLWVSNVLLALDDGADAEAAVARLVDELLAVRARRPDARPGARSGSWIVVSNEVGLGIVPPTPLGRSYRDALGRANRLAAAAADAVTMMVAGLELPLKR